MKLFTINSNKIVGLCEVCDLMLLTGNDIDHISESVILCRTCYKSKNVNDISLLSSNIVKELGKINNRPVEQLI